MSWWSGSLVVAICLTVVINALDEWPPNSSMEPSELWADDGMDFSDLGNFFNPQETPLLSSFNPRGQVEHPTSALPELFYDSSSSNQSPIVVPQTAYQPTSWGNKPTSSSLHMNSNKIPRVGPQTGYPPAFWESPPKRSNFHIWGETGLLEDIFSSTKSSELFFNTDSDPPESSLKATQTGFIPSTEPCEFMDTDINISNTLSLFEHGSPIANEESEMNIQTNNQPTPQIGDFFNHMGETTGLEKKNHISEEFPQFIHTNKEYEDNHLIFSTLEPFSNLDKDPSKIIHDARSSRRIVQPLNFKFPANDEFTSTQGLSSVHQQKIEHHESCETVSLESPLGSGTNESISKLQHHMSLKNKSQVQPNQGLNNLNHNSHVKIYSQEIDGIFHRPIEEVVSIQRHHDIPRIQFNPTTVACKDLLKKTTNRITALLSKIKQSKFQKKTTEVSEFVKTIHQISRLKELEAFQGKELCIFWKQKNKKFLKDEAVWYKYWKYQTGIDFESSYKEKIQKKIQRIFPTLLVVAEIIITIIQNLTEGHCETKEEYVQKLRKASECFLALGKSVDEDIIESNDNFRNNKLMLKRTMKECNYFSVGLMWVFIQFWIEKEYPEIFKESSSKSGNLSNNFKTLFNILFSVSIENLTDYYKGLDFQEKHEI